MKACKDFPFDRNLQELFEKILSSEGKKRDVLIGKYTDLIEKKDRQIPVIRGGSWNGVARDCRSAIRDGDGPGDRNHFLGFRLARSVALDS